MSVVSTATIRSTNPKESKDRRNLERLLAGPVGSDFSLTGQEVDLEMDYYDYNVVNAGAAPGSYLGMDPAFLVWIPPLDESGEILQDLEREVGDIRAKQHIDPGSNTESPEDEMLLPKTRAVADDNKLTFIHCSGSGRSSIRGESRGSIESIEKEDAVKVVSIQLHEFPKLRKGSGSSLRTKTEKETVVEKPADIDSNKLEDIKFADEEEEQDENVRTDEQCNIGIAYQHSSILSSS